VKQDNNVRLRVVQTVKDGDRFSRLLVLKEVKPDRAGKRFLCLCNCSATKTIHAYQLRNGDVKSCGCFRREMASKQISVNVHAKGLHRKPRSHGHTIGKKPSRTYISYRRMLDRTQNINSNRYAMYGSKGVRVCDRWDPARGGSFQNFLADMKERPAGMSIGRIDGTKGYNKNNCRWETAKQQAIEMWSRRRQNSRTGIVDGK